MASPFDLVTYVGLVIALVLFSVLTARIWRSGGSTTSSLRFQLSLVVVLWLAAEVSTFLLPSGESAYGGSGAEITVFDALHLAGMVLFAGFISWRVLKYSR